MKNNLLNIFESLSKIDLDDNYKKILSELTINKKTYNKQKNKIYLYVKSNSFLDLNILTKINDITHELVKSINNTKIKIIYEIDNDNLTKDILFQYIKFIKNVKSQNSTAVWDFIINNFDFINDTKTLIFDCSGANFKQQIEKEMIYIVKKLSELGIRDIKYTININKIYTDHIINNSNNNTVIKNIVRTQKKEDFIQKPTTTKYNYSLEKPTYKYLKDLDDEAQNVVIHGFVLDKVIRPLKTANRKIYILDITDKTSSIKAVYFSKNESTPELENITEKEKADSNLENIKKSKININDWIAVKGKMQYSSFDQEMVFYIESFAKINKTITKRSDNNDEKRVELHTHTKMSVMDGISDPEDYIKLVDSWNWKSIAFTDHLNVQAYPEIYNIQKQVNKNKKEDDKLKIIYGIEMNTINKDNIWYVKNPKNQLLKNSKLVIFDLETTGLSPEMDEIIEFGAVIYDLSIGTRESIDILIKPEQKLKEFTKNLTNITDEMLEDKPTIDKAFLQIKEIIKDSILIAHNANFDYNFLNNWSIKLGHGNIENTVIDTLALSRTLYPEFKNHRLGTIAKKKGILYDDEVAHRGDYDADILTNIFEIMWNDAKKIDSIEYDTDFDKLKPTDDSLNLNYHRNFGYHVNILAKNQEGLKEIYKLVSYSHTKNFFSGAKIFIDKILEFKKNNNILIGSSCVNSEIFELARTNTYKKLEKEIKKYDYVEIQPISVYKNLFQNDSLSEEELFIILNKIISVAKANNILIVATSDAHYTDKELKFIREIYIHSKGLGGSRHPLFDYKKRVKDYPEQHLRTTSEMLEEFSWLDDDEFINEIVIKNTNKIADMIDINIKPIKDGLYTPKIANVDEKLTAVCYENTKKIYGENLPEIVKTRLEKELNSIIKHGFAIVYWICHLLVKKSLEDGYLVGSRGSVGSSFVATMANITEVNPLKPHYICIKCQFSDFNTPKEFVCGYDLPEKKCPKCDEKLLGQGHDIPFETFLGFDGDKIPDIDLNFSGEYQIKAHDYVKLLFGENNVFRAGTISTVAEKTAFGYVKNFFEENQYRLNQPRKTEINRLTKLATGIKRTTGQHPGGIIILPNEYEIEDFTPINYPADDVTSSWKTTHFDFRSIHDNLLKMDILGHVDPTALKMLRDLTGIDPLTIPLNDKKVYSLFSNLDALNITSDKINDETTGAIGVPEFGTKFVREMLKDTKPKTFADLVQISGLSHGTDVWLGNAKDLIKNNTADISTVIGCRDDIMVYLMKMGIENGLAFNIMESVRKGKGLKSSWIDIMIKHNVPSWYIDSCLKIKYMFPKAHATAYVLMAYRVAWFKVYYPAEYYATFLSTRIDVFDLETAIKGYNEVLKKYKETEYNLAHNIKITKKEEDLQVIFEILLEMFSRGIKFSNVILEESSANKFLVKTDEQNNKIIVPPFTSVNSLGIAVAESIINARNEKPFTGKKDLQRRTQVTKTHIKIFSDLNIISDDNDAEQLNFNF